MIDLAKALSENSYPGRGIVLGRSEDGKKAVVGYFIMGRSENSRNRVFVEEPDGIRTEAFDPSKMVDPSLIIYHPVRKVGDTLVVTNGDQTDTVADYLRAGKTFEDALRTRTFEPDGPNWTPRISGMVEKNNRYTYSTACLSSRARTAMNPAPAAISSNTPTRAPALSTLSTPTRMTATRFPPSWANRKKQRSPAASTASPSCCGTT